MPETIYTFPQTVLDLYGEAGAEWLEWLPGLISCLSEEWQIQVGEAYPNLSYHYVAPATLVDGRQAVLKLGVPGGLLEREIAALRLYDGRGAAAVLAVDLQATALLLEHLIPGTPLSQVKEDDAATRTAARIMGQLWRSLPEAHSFTPIHEVTAALGRLRVRFDGGYGPFPTRLVNQAEGIFHELLTSAGEPVLLHGDLHHENILQASEGPDELTWKAIDPQGFAGEREYEIGCMLRNPIPQILEYPGLDQVIARRLEIFHEMLGFDRQRMAGWGFAQAILSAWWDFEDHGRGWEAWLAIAEAIMPGL